MFKGGKLFSMSQSAFEEFSKLTKLKTLSKGFPSNADN